MLAQDLPLPPPCQDTGGVLIEAPEFIIPALQQKIVALEAQVAQLELENRGLRSQNRLLHQLSQALGNLNRYFASLALGHPPTDNEAFDHYVLNGGKEAFDKTHPAG